MDRVSGRWDHIFEELFWSSIFACISEEILSVCKVTFE